MSKKLRSDQKVYVHHLLKVKWSGLNKNKEQSEKAKQVANTALIALGKSPLDLRSKPEHQWPIVINKKIRIRCIGFEPHFCKVF